MKVIDLLVKIVNGEEVPKQIKFNNTIYTYNDDCCDYFYIIPEGVIINFLFKGLLRSDAKILKNLRTEIEVIKEGTTKEIEKLNLDTDRLRGKESVRAIDYLLEGKINEIIEKLNELEK